MDYKEKYNKLVEAIKVLQEANPSDEGIQNWVNDNVPELAESEDEKARKRIITLVNRHGQGRFRDSMLAWLEKQGQKPVWSEEDEEMCQNILECLRNGWRKLPTDILKYETWLKSIRQRIGGES